jgi:hypothetical protein
MRENENNIQGDIVPTLRQGIDIIKMVVFKALKPHVENRYPQLAPEETGRLTGAVINHLFGIEDMDASMETFTAANQHLIDAEVAAFAENFDHLRIPLTDALRVQYLCDGHEGLNSETILANADKLKILISEREVPMPGAFMSIVRSFGVAYKILEPMNFHAPSNNKKQLI